MVQVPITVVCSVSRVVIVRLLSKYVLCSRGKHNANLRKIRKKRNENMYFISKYVEMPLIFTILAVLMQPRETPQGSREILGNQGEFRMAEREARQAIGSTRKVERATKQHCGTSARAKAKDERAREVPQGREGMS